jgi:hypothetical protein
MDAPAGARIGPRNEWGCSYVYREDGVAASIRGSRLAMEIAAVTAGRLPSFLWFTREGKAYLVTDETSLAKVGEVHARRPDAPAADQSENAGERLRRLADELVSSGAARPFDQ